MQTYESHIECRKAYRENNDCAVRALSALLDCSYGLVHRKLKRQGRKNGRGTAWSHIRTACKQICEMKGREVSWHGFPEYRAKYSKARGFNVLSIGAFQRQHPKGTYLLSMSGHVATLRNGELVDWTGNSSKRHLLCGYIKLEK